MSRRKRGVGVADVLFFAFRVVWLLLLAVVLLVRVLLIFAVPRKWRISYRKAHGREGARSARITARQRRMVLAADRHRCVYCGSAVQPEVDHRRPWSAGGMTHLLNLFVLCSLHNKIASNYWVARDGYVFYRPWPGHDNRVMAAQIRAAEHRAGWNPVRWVRALWAL